MITAAANRYLRAHKGTHVAVCVSAKVTVNAITEDFADQVAESGQAFIIAAQFMVEVVELLHSLGYVVEQLDTDVIKVSF